MLNKEFGTWRTIEQVDQSRYLCECNKCGRRAIRTKENLKITRGCRKCVVKGIKNPFWKGCGKVTGIAYGEIKKRARTQKRELTVSIEYLSDLFEKQDCKCAITGLELSFDNSNLTASLDRIDSSKGYIDGNVWWVHKYVNLMKLDLSMEEFLKWCELVAKNNEKM